MHSISSTPKTIIKNILGKEENLINMKVEKLLKDTYQGIKKSKQIVNDMIKSNSFNMEKLIDCWGLKEKILRYPGDIELKELKEWYLPHDQKLLKYLSEGKSYLIKPNDIPKLEEDLKELRSKLHPLIKNAIKESGVSEDYKKQLLTQVDNFEYYETFKDTLPTKYLSIGAVVDTLLNFSKFAKEDGFFIYITGGASIEFYALDLTNIQKAIQSKDFSYFGKKFNDYLDYQRKYWYNQVMQSQIDYGKEQTIANVFNITAEEEGYLIEKLIEEEEIAYVLIEMHYEWRNLAYNIIGDRAIMRFEPKVLNKLMQDCEEIINKPNLVREIVDKEKGTLVEEEKYKGYLKLVPKIASKIKSVVEDAIEKNYEVVISGTVD